MTQNLNNLELAKLGNTVKGPIIKKSTIKNIGFGLFADKDYKKNEKITVYGGKLEYKKIDGEYVFMLCADPPVYINGEVDFHPSEKGRWINHGNKNTPNNTPNKTTVLNTKNIANTKFVLSLAKTNLNAVGEFPICYVIASRDIKKGEEFFVDYGPLYW